MRTSHVPALLVALLLVTSAATAVTATRTTTPGNPPEPTTKDHPPSEGANFTVVPSTHKPGASTDFLMLSKGKAPWDGSKGLKKIGYYKITTQKSQFIDCTPSNARAFGIDRNNDAGGTKTDEPLLQHMESYSVEGRVITVNIWDEDDFSGEPTHLNSDDETVAKLVDCAKNPSKPGWYQFTGYVNGTNYQGNFQEVTLYSNYFYICDCKNRQEAKQKLGPPPYSGGSGSGGSGGGTPTATTTPGGNGPTATPTSGDSPGGSTPTPTDVPKQNSPTATSGGNNNGGGSNNGGNNDGGGGSGGNNNGGGNANNGGNNAGSTATGANASGAPKGTPTVAGPGFGAVLALVALLGGALLAVRRSR